MGPGPALVGRPAELATLDALLLSVSRGRGTALAVVGEAGIGKSRLLAELGERADALGMLVLSGAASEFEQDLPFWPFVDALDDYVRSLPPARLTTLDDDARSELAHVLPSWPVPAQAASGEDRRYRTHRSVSRLLEMLAGGPPLVLLLDDLHWADSGSVELLCALLRRPPAGPVLLATALRPRQVAARLAGALHRAADTGLLTRVELAPLTLADTRRLLGTDIDESLVPTLHAESGGNPFYLRQLAQVRRTAGGPPRARRSTSTCRPPSPRLSATSWPTSTTSPGARWRRRRSPAIPSCWRSPPPRRRCRRPRWPTPSTNCSTATSSARPTAPDGSGSGIRWFAARSTGPRRPAGGSALTSAARRRWRRAACRSPDGPTTSSRRPASATRRRSACSGTPGRRSSDVRPARRHAGSPRLSICCPRPRPRTPSSCGRQLAGAHGAAGRFADARAALLRAIDLAPEGAGATRVRLIAECAGIEQTLGHHDDAHRRLVAALDALPDLDGAEALALMGAIAQDRLYRTEYAAAQAVVTAGARRRRTAVGDGRVRHRPCARSGVRRGHHRGRDGVLRSRDARGWDVRRGGRRICGSDDRPSRRGRAPRRPPRRRRPARRTRAGRRPRARLPPSPPGAVLDRDVRTALGRLAEATSLLDEAVEAARTSGNPAMLGWILLARSTTASAAGEIEVALATAQESVAVLRGPIRTLPAAWSAHTLATAVASTDPAAAERALVSSCGTDLHALPQPLRSTAFGLLTRCRLALDHPAAADAVAAARRVRRGVRPGVGAGYRRHRRRGTHDAPRAAAPSRGARPCGGRRRRLRRRGRRGRIRPGARRSRAGRGRRHRARDRGTTPRSGRVRPVRRAATCRRRRTPAARARRSRPPPLPPRNGGSRRGVFDRS